MTPFAALPFEEQLERIGLLVSRGEDPLPLLREAGVLPDAEPLGRLLDALAERGVLAPAIEGELAALLPRLADPALQHLLVRPSHPRIAETLERLAEDALLAWPAARIGALALLSRWLRRRAPQRHVRVVEHAERALDAAGDGRWLLFASGRRLAELERDPAWAGLVAETTAAAVDALARAPKSISQANAERLLAQRVYADPGHFFFELLQNADDAGATRWSASIETNRVVIAHDGAPFSFLDLVGVLSIGQTTKRVEQIGFFGVGFKSVYEICERPRVHSGALSFEIAHVSIPRAIAGVTSADETTVILPYARAIDPALLHQQALAIPPETLMALPNVAAMTVRGPAGEVRAWTQSGEGDRVVLSDGAETRHYRCVTRTLRFDGAREEGRARESPVLVAVAAGPDGPTPVLGPTLYAFLPTAERSGLRVLVHARFDVTLDRERLEQDSPWNDALLAQAGAALADAAVTFAAEGAPVLGILSSPDELSPTMAPLARALADALHDRPCLPGAAGETIAPRRARLLPPALGRALAGVDLDRGTRALAELGPRESAVVSALGAQPFETDDLLAWLADTLVPGKPPPAWLGSAVLEAIAAGPGEQLQALPILVDGGGAAVAPRDALLAPAAWAALYAGARPIVSISFLAGMPPALRKRLVIEPFDARLLAVDLRDAERLALCLSRSDALFDAIDDLSDELLFDLADAPIWPTRTGARAALAEGLVALDPLLEPIAPALAAAMPILDPSFATRRAARVIPRFGFAELAAAIERGVAIAGEDALESLLDDAGPQLPRALARRFAMLPLFRDRRGKRRPLIGEGRALAPNDAALASVLPDWPWLAAPAAPFVVAVEPPAVDARAIASALLADRSMPSIPSAALPAVQAWLGAHGGDLASTQIDALAQAPIWLDVTGVPHPIDALRRGTRSAALDAFYAALSMTRAVAAPATLQFARALRLDARLPASDFATVVGDILREGPPDVPRDVLAGVLAEASLALRPDELAPLRSVRLFADERGELRALASWTGPDQGACHRPGAFRTVLRAGSLPLLAEEDEARFAAWLAVAGPAAATVLDVARRAPELAADPDALLRFAREHAGALDEGSRSALAQLPIFASRSGRRRPSAELADRTVFAEILGDARLAALDIDDVLLDPAQLHLVRALGAPLRPASSVLAERVLAKLTENAPLDAQPWPTREDLLALLTLAYRVDARVDTFPLEVDAQGRLTRGPLRQASDAVRRLISGLDLAGHLADPAWAAALPPEHVLAPMEPRRIAEALRAAHPEEASLEAGAIDAAALYTWLREDGEAIASDESAKAALAAAAVLPSQRGTLRAPRDLVLDPNLPELGLGWGLAPDVPPDVGRWLRATFQLDRRAREAIAAHVLDGVDAAAERDDRPGAQQLIAFLARALGAGEVTPEQLEERVRRLQVRARLRVPLADGTWTKPRFAWTASDDVAEHAESFALDLPPRIALVDLPPHARALMAACGARDDLDEATVERCLDGEGLREGAAARRALARYVVDRALAQPARRERWKLATRKWVPAADGTLHRPAALVWPDTLAHALFGEGHPRFPDPGLVFDLPEDAGDRLGFARAATLSLAEVAAEFDDREARPALLDWLEAGLRDRRFAPREVHDALADRIRLRDDDGILRAPSELAVSGARALFGTWRGDFSQAREHALLARALEIPTVPGTPMISQFLAEIGERLPSLGEHEQSALTRLLPAALERLGELPGERPLPHGAALAGMRGDTVVLARIGDAALRMLSPITLADSLEDASPFVDPLPIDRDDALTERLLASGVPDLWSAFEVNEVIPGPRRESLDEAAAALHEQLAGLGTAVGRRARVVEGLGVRGVLRTGAAEGYRGPAAIEITVPVEAAIDDGTLLLTPIALASPVHLAPALARDPIRRAALMRWLAAGSWERAAPAPKTRTGTEASSESTGGIFSRIKRLFIPDEAPAPKPAASRSPRATTKARERRDDGFFRPNNEIESQLDHTEGWLEDRQIAPDFGFSFAPPRLESPWLYAPKLIATRFDRRGQRWDQARLLRPESRGDAGTVVMQGRLPPGEAIIPIPLYGRLIEARSAGDAPSESMTGPNGATALRVADTASLRLRIALGRLPDLAEALPADVDALAFTVPDDELPEEVLDFVADLDDQASALDRSLTIRDFIRARYRYDPGYLEDPSIGHWLARVTRGRANAHIAALHAAGDTTHLGAGVCYELNALACELLRRAGIPAALATGWVLDGGALSEPDHLWTLALLVDRAGAPVWLPVDASTTRTGRPLRVPRRPPGKFRPPKDPAAKAPPPPRWDTERPAKAAKPKKKKAPPRAELTRLLHYLERITGRPIDPATRTALQRALDDPEEALRLLARLLGE